MTINKIEICNVDSKNEDVYDLTKVLHIKPV